MTTEQEDNQAEPIESISFNSSIYALSSMRRQALELAVKRNYNEDSTEKVLAEAQNFFLFLSGSLPPVTPGEGEISPSSK